MRCKRDVTAPSILRRIDPVRLACVLTSKISRLLGMLLKCHCAAGL